VRRLVSFFVLVAALFAIAAPVQAASSAVLPVTVTGNPGEKPTVTVTKPVAVKASRTAIVTPGTGPKTAKGDTITLDYVVLNGRSGAEIETSYGKTPVSLVLDPKQATPVLVKSLTGVPVGSRVLVAVAPKEGLASSGQVPDLKKSDTLLFVVEVTGASKPLARAEGDAVPPVAGLPTATLGKKGAPTIAIPKSDPPSTLIVQPLIKGTGPVVQKGQTVTVQYVGVVWASGKTFDSSWSRGKPVGFAIGTGSVIPGWDEGLVGQTVGSQVLLVIPPDKGYGASGNSQAGIAGTDTLVFVVDILAAI